MDVRSRRSTATAKPGPTVLRAKKVIDDAKASDALPMPLYVTNVTFFTLFFSVVYFLLTRWREKIRTSTPLHVLTFSEISAIFALIASFIYLLGFFGIDFIQSLILRPSSDVWADDDTGNWGRAARGRGRHRELGEGGAGRESREICAEEGRAERKREMDEGG